MTRRFIKRKYRPGFEALEHKQLPSAVLPTLGPQSLVQAAAPVPAQAQQETILPCGTGRGIVIITG